MEVHVLDIVVCGWSCCCWCWQVRSQTVMKWFCWWWTSMDKRCRFVLCSWRTVFYSHLGNSWWVTVNPPPPMRSKVWAVCSGDVALFVHPFVCLDLFIHRWPNMVGSDVTELIKLRIRRMRISTHKFVRMRVWICRPVIKQYFACLCRRII